MINPIHVQKYIRCRGWILEEVPTSAPYLYYQHPDDVYAQLDLPIDAELRSFVSAIEEVVDRLAEFEKRSKNEVVQDLLHLNDDLADAQI